MEKIKYECKWNPHHDITAFELAECIPFMFSKLHEIKEWEALPERITRHFIVSTFDYGGMINKAAEGIKELMDSECDCGGFEGDCHEC